MPLVHMFFKCQLGVHPCCKTVGTQENPCDVTAPAQLLLDSSSLATGAGDCQLWIVQPGQPLRRDRCHHRPTRQPVLAHVRSPLCVVQTGFPFCAQVQLPLLTRLTFCGPLSSSQPRQVPCSRNQKLYSVGSLEWELAGNIQHGYRGCPLFFPSTFKLW